MKVLTIVCLFALASFSLSRRDHEFGIGPEIPPVVDPEFGIGPEIPPGVNPGGPEIPYCAVLNCHTCVIFDANSCVSCKFGYNISNDGLSCNNQSSNCPIGCIDCENQFSCLSCSDGYTMTYISVCGAVNGCGNNCAICDPLDLEYCIECHPGYAIRDINAHCSKKPVCPGCAGPCNVETELCDNCESGYTLTNGTCVSNPQRRLLGFLDSD